VSFKENSVEYKNFQPIKYWIKLLEKHKFIPGERHLLQHKDPSENTLVIFSKK
jgi:hypothetical protein